MTRGKPRRRDSAKEAFWRQMVSQWGDSGLTVRAFCEEQGQNESRFYWWKRQLKRRSTENHRSSRVSHPGGSSEGSCPSFLPIQILQEADSARWAIEGGGYPGASLTVVLPSGYRIEVSRGFDEQSLGRLLGLLESRGC